MVFAVFVYVPPQHDWMLTVPEALSVAFTDPLGALSVSACAFTRTGETLPIDPLADISDTVAMVPSVELVMPLGPAVLMLFAAVVFEAFRKKVPGALTVESVTVMAPAYESLMYDEPLLAVTVSDGLLTATADVHEVPIPVVPAAVRMTLVLPVMMPVPVVVILPEELSVTVAAWMLSDTESEGPLTV